MSKLPLMVMLVTLVGIGAFAAMRAQGAEAPSPEKKNRFFEMRTYTAAEGKLDALHKRFREHTNNFFAKHGMTIVGFWTPTEGDAAKNTLVYILAYPDKEARDKAWQAFQADPDWITAKAGTEKDGKLVDKVVSVFMAPTDYSPIK
jgi:hypothetical protein